MVDVRRPCRQAVALLSGAVLLAPAAELIACEQPAGEVRVVSKAVAGSSVPQLHVSAVMDSPAERVWKIISDCNGYKNSMPRTIASKEIAKGGGRSVCETEIHMPFPFANLHSQAEFVDTLAQGRWVRTFRQLRGDYVKSEGSWTVTPCGPDGSQSLVAYELHAILKVVLPDSMVRRGQVAAMHEMFGKIRQLARK